MKIIGIDIGTTSICGVSVDSENGEIIKSVTKPNNSFIPSAEEFEKIQNPDLIMDCVYSVISELDITDASAIGFSGQMHGIVYTDINGKAVSPLYIWQDERAAKEYKDGKSYAQYLNCFPGYGLATDFYNEINGLIPENAVRLCTIADYAVMQLCGNTEPLIHITNAASLGCFDILNNRFTVENPRLPEVTTEFKAAGEYNGIPVCVALGDNQASFIGSVSNKDDALVNVGTGSQISWLTESPVESSSVENRPFDGKRYLAAGCALCGGRAFAMLENFFREIINSASGIKVENCYGYLDKILEAKTETSLYADCRFCGTRNDPSIRGGFSNLSESNFTPADFALAVLNGMTSELYEMYKSGGKPARKIVCSGNGMRKNSALRRITGDMFGCEIEIPLYAEEASYGAALAASVACGINENIDKACTLIKYKED